MRLKFRGYLYIPPKEFYSLRELFAVESNISNNVESITDIILRIPGHKNIALSYVSEHGGIETANFFVSSEGVFYCSYGQMIAEDGIKHIFPNLVQKKGKVNKEYFVKFLKGVLGFATGNIIIRQVLDVEAEIVFKKGKARLVSQEKIYGIMLHGGNWKLLSKEEIEEVHAGEAEETESGMKRKSRGLIFIYSDLSEFI